MADGRPGQQIGLPWLPPLNEVAVTEKEVSNKDRAFLCRAAADAMQKHIQAKHDSANRTLALPPTAGKAFLARSPVASPPSPNDGGGANGGLGDAASP